MRRSVDANANHLTPHRWKFRGIGGDHEIIVRLRSHSIDQQQQQNDNNDRRDQQQDDRIKEKPPLPSPPPAAVIVQAEAPVETPPKLKCAQCKKDKLSPDFWWCRTCQKSLCSVCNLLEHHTEHRSCPWRPDELVRSLVETVEARCTARSQRAAEEEAAVGEYMREIENYFLQKLRARLCEHNDVDRSLAAAVCAATGLTSPDRRRWPPRNEPVGFDHMTDSGVVALVNEIGGLLPPDGVQTLTVTKWPRADSVGSSPLVGVRSMSFGAQRRPSGADDQSDDPERSPSAVNARFYAFAAVLPDVEPLEFARRLEQQFDSASRIRTRSHSATGHNNLPPRSVTPFTECLATSRSHSPAMGVNGAGGSVPLTVYGSANVDTVDGRCDASFTVNGSSAATMITRPIAEKHCLSSDPIQNSIQQTVRRTTSAVDDRSPVGSGKWPTSGNRSESVALSTETPPRNGTDRSPRSGDSPDEGSPTLADTSVESGQSKSSPISITAFHFGDDFLTRPIDVRVLNGNRLAVSDSCGGVYITDPRGDVLHRIWLDGQSASSLCYLPSTRPHEQYPPILLVSVLRKQARELHFYDVRDFSLLDSVSCPKEPDIDLGRCRWLAADDRSAIFLVSGDGKLSALWKYNASSRNWVLLKKAPKTRYQYLDVVNGLADAASVTLLTCDGLCGSLLLITISRSATAGQNKILSEQDFSHAYGLHQYIRSPAAAVVDRTGNMLVLDYSNGKLWLLKTPSNNRHGERRLKLLTEVGGQQAIGLTTVILADGDRWCYLACFNKKRIHAVKYLADD